MFIEDNIIKAYLKNVFFIAGTAYSGKSTMCKMLAERYHLHLCEENYNSEEIFSIANVNQQPNLCYFKTKKDWQEFINRTPKEYCDWLRGTSQEVAGFEVAHLIRISKSQKVIVDTNIPIEILQRICDYHQVAVMLTPQSMSVDCFFERKDPEKQFLLEQIKRAKDPEKTMQNFREILAEANSQQEYDRFLNSGFFTMIRQNNIDDTKEETLKKLAVHFGLEQL